MRARRERSSGREGRGCRIGKAASGRNTQTGIQGSCRANGTLPAGSREPSSRGDGRGSPRGSLRTESRATATSCSAGGTLPPGAASEPAGPTAEAQQTRHSSCHWAALVLVRTLSGGRSCRRRPPIAPESVRSTIQIQRVRSAGRFRPTSESRTPADSRSAPPAGSAARRGRRVGRSRGSQWRTTLRRRIRRTLTMRHSGPVRRSSPERREGAMT
jgi:hypothetical protein